jgi:hypothetical protein
MTTDLQQIALVAYLKARDALYYGKVLELRQAVEDWLSSFEMDIQVGSRGCATVPY